MADCSGEDVGEFALTSYVKAPKKRAFIAAKYDEVNGGVELAQGTFFLDNSGAIRRLSGRHMDDSVSAEGCFSQGRFWSIKRRKDLEEERK